MGGSGGARGCSAARAAAPGAGVGGRRWRWCGAPAAAEDEHREVERFDVFDHRRVPSDREVPAADAIGGEGVGAAAHDDDGGAVALHHLGDHGGGKGKGVRIIAQNCAELQNCALTLAITGLKIDAYDSSSIPASSGKLSAWCFPARGEGRGGGAR